MIMMQIPVSGYITCMCVCMHMYHATELEHFLHL
jgi:hypothetical protein